MRVGRALPFSESFWVRTSRAPDGVLAVHVGALSLQPHVEDLEAKKLSQNAKTAPIIAVS